MNKEYRRQLRCAQTDAEKKLWRCLRNRGLMNCKFRRQHPLGSYIVDFCCVENGIVIELDGSQHKMNLSEDRERTRFLNVLGYRVLRFWDNEVFESIDGVLEKIRLELTPPHPGLLPSGEKEKNRAKFNPASSLQPPASSGKAGLSR